MSKDSLVLYFVLWLLLQLLEVNSQMTPFTPSVQNGHTATFINNKLYILGGIDVNSKALKEFFYLDTSVSFNTQGLPWKDLSNINIVPPHNAATSVKGGANNDTLFLYGVDEQILYTFNSSNNSWSIPKITGTAGARKTGLTGFLDNKGKLYLWGGSVNDLFVNDMLILDTINFNLGKGTMVNAPIPRGEYAATLLPNQSIIYMGGINTNSVTFYNADLSISEGNVLTLSEVHIYDTINDSWSTKVTTGQIPSNRASFSAILGLDGQRVIIFGGLRDLATGNASPLCVLDLTNFNWYIPTISGNIPKVRAWHKATLIGKYMAISFGQGYDRLTESDILLLDISNNEEYKWTTIFDPLPPPPPPPSPSPSSSSQPQPIPLSSSNIKPATMIGAIVGSVFGGILLSLGCFLLYKRNKIRKELRNTILIPGNINYKNHNHYDRERVMIFNEKNIQNHGQEAILTSPVINSNNYNHGQEAILTSPVINSNNYNHGQEIVQTPINENTTNHEPAIDRNYNHGQEAIPTSDNNADNALENLKNEMLLAVKQEINQNLKNEILQVVRQENSNIARENAKHN